MNQDEDPAEDSPQERRRINWLIVAIVAAIAAGVLLASSVWDGSWNASDGEDSNEVAAAPQSDPEKYCAAQATYDLIRRELFRRAAQVRGSDEQAYTRLADFALLRVNGPVVRSIDEQVGSVTCSGEAVLSLPPGVAVSGGRRSMSGDVDYMVQPAADGTGNVVRLGNADSIVVPLATLNRTAASRSEPLVPPELGNATDSGPAEQPDEMEPQPETSPSQPARANPSFNCANARTRSENAVCGDPGLAALDRQMAGQFNRSLIESDRRQRELLERTRSRFLTYRDRCATNQCIADTYRSRMREIEDIMADRWRG